MIFLWDFKRLPMEFQWDSCGISKGISMGFLQESLGFSTVFLLDFHDISLRLLSDFSRISMGMKKDFYDLLMVFPGDSFKKNCWIFMGFLWALRGISMVFLWNFLGFPKGVHGISS